jgi:hypothetical protein
LEANDSALLKRLLAELDKQGRQALLSWAIANKDMPLLELLTAQSGLSTAGLALHDALGWLPWQLTQKLVAAGAGINVRSGQDGSLLTHKASARDKQQAVQTRLL